MENTNCAENCAFVKNGFCNSDKECPHYIESWWTLDGQNTPKLVKDCFPKKFSLEQNAVVHRMFCLQSSIEQLRNRIHNLENLLNQLVEKIPYPHEEIFQKNKFLNDQEIHKKIE